MTLAIHLLGRPRIESESRDVYQFRSRKSWALLAFLILSERPPTRNQLAFLLFAEADDPLRALRWSLSEIRRSLGEDGTLDGDPVELSLADDTAIDVAQVMKGSWVEAVCLPGLGMDLLDGLAIRGAPGFESWFLSEQRYVAAASEALLHEAALGTMARGDFESALDYAIRASLMSPLDENHQALLIRLYRLTGDDTAAERQFAVCADLLDREFGLLPGPVVQSAMRETRAQDDLVADPSSVEAVIEAGHAAVAAGAVEAGVQSLRTSVRLADATEVADIRVRARLVLAEALIHSLRGLDGEGVAALHEADDIALAGEDRSAVAQARAELGYVDFLRARYDRAEMWLTDALEFGDGSPAIVAKAKAYLGSVESDRANYGRAVDLLGSSIELSRAVADPRREAYGLSMLGRIDFLRGDLDAAADQLDASIALAGDDHWLAFLPWPQALRGEVELARGEPERAADLLRQAFARACQLGDPCWEGIGARGLAMVAEATGDTDQAFEVLADARARCNRLADPYVWLDGYILDAQCALGIRHDHGDTGRWIDAMWDVASRAGMKELTVRSLLHRAALGHEGDRLAARLLATDIDNPSVHGLIAPPIDGA